MKLYAAFICFCVLFFGGKASFSGATDSNGAMASQTAFDLQNHSFEEGLVGSYSHYKFSVPGWKKCPIGYSGNTPDVHNGNGSVFDIVDLTSGMDLGDQYLGLVYKRISQLSSKNECVCGEFVDVASFGEGAEYLFDIAYSSASSRSGKASELNAYHYHDHGNPANLRVYENFGGPNCRKGKLLFESKHQMTPGVWSLASFVFQYRPGIKGFLIEVDGAPGTGGNALVDFIRYRPDI